MSKMKIKCPMCGTELTAHVTIEAARSAMNEVSKSARKAQRRIEALRAAGIDTTGMLAMNTGQVARLQGGLVTVLDDDDEVFQAIRRGGTIPNGTLWRRWVTTQMFHMLAHPKGFTEALREKGCRYPWRMLKDELHAQQRMQQAGDLESLEERVMWFGRAEIVLIINEVLSNIIIDRQEKKKVIWRLDHGNPSKAFELIANFARFHDLPIPKAFIDSYKGAGAYFTMRDLIKFHGCRFEGMNEQNSLTHLRMLAEEYSSHMEGYKMLGALKEFLRYNGIDVKQRVTDWSKVRGVMK